MKIRYGFLLVCCFTALLLSACGKYELQIAGNTLDPNAPPTITLFAPRDGLVAEDDIFVFEWAANAPYEYTFHITAEYKYFTNVVGLVTNVIYEEDPNTGEMLPVDEVVTDVEEITFLPDFDSHPILVYRIPDGAAYAVSYYEGTLYLPLTANSPLGVGDPGYQKKRVFWAIKGEAAGVEIWSATNVIEPELDRGSVVISEVAYRSSKSNPTATKPGGQGYYLSDFVELHNTTEFSIDIGGWVLEHYDKDGAPRAVSEVMIPYGTVIFPHGFFVIGHNSAQFQNAFSIHSFAHTRAWLDIGALGTGGKGFKFRLRDKRAVYHDECLSTKMPKEPGDSNYASLERVRPPNGDFGAGGGSGMVVSNWKFATGLTNVNESYTTYTRATPGAKNSIWE